jgi:hypothetical protein
MGGEPAGYDAAAYGRDSKVFHAFVKRVAPRLVILGPGSVGERAAGGLGSLSSRMIEGETLLVAAGPGVDAFSYHHYGTVSQRCARGRVDDDVSRSRSIGGLALAHGRAARVLQVPPR